MSDQPQQKAPRLALYPIYFADDNFVPPTKGGYYLIAKNGIFFNKETKVGTALVPVKGIPWLDDAETNVGLNLPKIPGRIIGQALAFFRKVFDKHKSEAYVTLMYSNKLNEYMLWCPVQTVTAGSVNYDRTDQPDFETRQKEDWQMVGTIHSHCDFSAFHSGTDQHDESTFDGVHITLGHVNRVNFSMCASLALNNHREEMGPENCCLGVTRVSNKTVTSNKWMNFGDTTYFELTLSEAEAQALVADAEMIEKEWMPKVTHGWKGGGLFGGTFQGWTGGKTWQETTGKGEDFDSGFWGAYQGD